MLSAIITLINIYKKNDILISITLILIALSIGILMIIESMGD